MSDENSKVDETPISPVERRNSLEKHLQQRPDPKELKDRHILLDTNAAPSIQSTALELERQLAADSLKKGLQHRPDMDELLKRNVLHDPTVAPALQAQQHELEMQMKANNLKKGLENRPRPEDLINKGILEADEDPREKAS
ncbi:MAG: hypothetical protein M1823_000172 [Watsoniomyces obsoletus]|nr:MAG: hypothetical protein M1823_000172 [Watsoniomyces obsoletus]